MDETKYQVTVVDENDKWVTVDIDAATVDQACLIAEVHGKPTRVWRKGILVWSAQGAEMEA